MRLFTAMGKLMLGTLLHGVPVVVNCSLPLSPSTAVSWLSSTNQTSAFEPFSSVVVEIGG